MTNYEKLSRLGRFIHDNGLKPNVVADVSGISRQYLLKLRFGRAEPTRPMMIWITVACRSLLGKRKRVRLSDLFDLEMETV